jgi:hypothetical protein
VVVAVVFFAAGLVAGVFAVLVLLVAMIFTFQE